MSSFFDKAKDAYRKEYESNPVFTVFLTILIAFFVVFVIAAIVTGGDTFYHVLCVDHNDTFMDYFNSVMYSYDHPYTYWKVIYPPLITVFYDVIGHFTMPYITTAVPSGTDVSFVLRDTQMGIVSFVIIMLVTFYALHLIYIKVMKGTSLRKELMFFFAILLSYPFLFALERGNSIILALVFCFLFLLGYRSENKWIRYASYIALGVAAGIKLYPAILWLLLIRERQYREAGICFIIVVAIIFVPFIFTDGTPLILFEKVTSYAGENLGAVNINQIVLGIFQEFLSWPSDIASAISLAVMGTFTLLSIIVIVFDREMKYWKVVALIACNLVVGIGLGIQYQMIYMIMPILYFLVAEKEMTKNNKFYLICFAMTLVLIPGITTGLIISTETVTTEIFPAPLIGAVESAFVFVISFALLHEGLKRLYRNYSAKRHDLKAP